MSINLNISYCLGKKTTTNSPDLAKSVKLTHTGVGFRRKPRRTCQIQSKTHSLQSQDPADNPNPVVRLQSPAGERRRRRREREREKQTRKKKKKKKKKKKEQCGSDGFIETICKLQTISIKSSLN